MKSLYSYVKIDQIEEIVYYVHRHVFYKKKIVEMKLISMNINIIYNLFKMTFRGF